MARQVKAMGGTLSIQSCQAAVSLNCESVSDAPLCGEFSTVVRLQVELQLADESVFAQCQLQPKSVSAGGNTL